MTRTITNKTLQSLARLKLEAAEALLLLLADPKLTPTAIRRHGVTILRVPYLRIPRTRATRKGPALPLDPAFAAFAEDFNARLAEFKLQVQTLFLKLLKDPSTPPSERERLATAVLRCGITALQSPHTTSSTPPAPSAKPTAPAASPQSVHTTTPPLTPRDLEIIAELEAKRAEMRNPKLTRALDTLIPTTPPSIHDLLLRQPLPSTHRQTA